MKIANWRTKPPESVDVSTLKNCYLVSVKNPSHPDEIFKGNYLYVYIADKWVLLKIKQFSTQIVRNQRGFPVGTYFLVQAHPETISSFVKSQGFKLELTVEHEKFYIYKRNKIAAKIFVCARNGKLNISLQKYQRVDLKKVVEFFKNYYEVYYNIDQSELKVINTRKTSNTDERKKNNVRKNVISS